MSTVTTISEREYQNLALNDPDRSWELWDGVLVEKPPMSRRHDDVAFFLGHLLQSQLDRAEFRVNVNGGKTRYTERNYFEPDVIVIPAALVQPFADDPYMFNACAEPLPLVVEIWSPSTGDYDIAAKIPLYRQRGDLEIVFLHPYEHMLTAWRGQLDGSYAEQTYRGGIVSISSLPGVTIELDALPAG